MSNNPIIRNLLDNKKIAIVGVSRNPKKFGYIVFKTMREKGYEVIPINPNAEVIDGVKCYKSIEELDENIKNLIVVTQKKETLNVITKSIANISKFENVWIQQGSETKEVIDLLDKNEINYISGQCILMYANPTGFHKFHQTIAKLFGLYKK